MDINKGKEAGIRIALDDAGRQVVIIDLSANDIVEKILNLTQAQENSLQMVVSYKKCSDNKVRVLYDTLDNILERDEDEEDIYVNTEEDMNECECSICEETGCSDRQIRYIGDGEETKIADMMEE